MHPTIVAQHRTLVLRLPKDLEFAPDSSVPILSHQGTALVCIKNKRPEQKGEGSCAAHEQRGCWLLRFNSWAMPQALDTVHWQTLSAESTAKLYSYAACWIPITGGPPPPTQ